jgi:NCAIR mutase (PurE)-related protein
VKESTRAWIYRVAVAAVPVLVGYGVVEDSKAALWVGLAGAVLGFGTNLLASANTSTKSDER